MKKFLKLTTREAIDHFLLKDNTLAPETDTELGFKLNKLHDLKSWVNVTIVIPTHRSAPDYFKDDIVLKNKIDEAEKQMYAIMDKRDVWPIAEALREAQQSVDHSLNLDTMVIYANAQFSSVVKLPIESDEELVIGDYFDLRPLYRAKQQNRNYYILTVSKHAVRLIEALNDKAYHEYHSGDFPFIKDSFYTVKWDKPAADGFADNMEKEFFNDADKSFRLIYAENPMPVVLAGDVKSVAYFEEQMDDSSMVVARVTGSYDQTPLHKIVEAVLAEVETFRLKRQREYLNAIDRAASEGKLINELRDMIDYARNGLADTLYIANDYSFSDNITGENLSDRERWEMKQKADQMLLGLMRDVSHNGGQIIFMSDVMMEKKFGGMAMSARYILDADIEKAVLEGSYESL